MQRKRFRRPVREGDAAPRRKRDDRAAVPAASGGARPGRDAGDLRRYAGGGSQAACKGGRLKGKVVVAADEHAIPRCDKGENGDLKGGKRKGRTNKFECHMTMQVVSGKSRVTLSSYQVANGEPQSHYLGALIENARRQGADIDTLLLDRSFNSVANIVEMERQRVRYVMPKSGNTRVYRRMEEADADPDEAVRPYVMKAKDGGTPTPTMVIVPKKIKPCSKKCGTCKRCKPVLIQDKYVAFLTNIPVDRPKKLLKHIPKKYRARWGHRDGGTAAWNPYGPRPRVQIRRRACSCSTLRWWWSTCGGTARRYKRRTGAVSRDAAARLRGLPVAARDRRRALVTHASSAGIWARQESHRAAIRRGRHARGVTTARVALSGTNMIARAEASPGMLPKPQGSRTAQARTPMRHMALG